MEPTQEHKHAQIKLDWIDVSKKEVNNCTHADHKKFDNPLPLKIMHNNHYTYLKKQQYMI